jgi:hypothetical protein
MYYSVVQSNYNYRNAPLCVQASYKTLPDLYLGVRPYYMKPRPLVMPGEPVLKTQKLLGGRAVISDSFSRPDFYRAWSTPDYTKPGMSYYSHRDGYNVLYGDSHASWYGDPQQRIMWFATSWGGGNGGHQYYNSLQFATIAAFACEANPASTYAEDSSQFVWHLMDMANGVDVDAR